jgi:hypothetical protein
LNITGASKSERTFVAPFKFIASRAKLEDGYIKYVKLLPLFVSALPVAVNGDADVMSEFLVLEVGVNNPLYMVFAAASLVGIVLGLAPNLKANLFKFTVVVLEFVEFAV